MPIDEGHKAQALRHGCEGGDIAVWGRADGEVGGRGPEEAREELISRTSMQQGERPWFAMDPA